MEQPNDDVFEQIKKQLDDGVYDQIKDFDRHYCPERSGGHYTFTN